MKDENTRLDQVAASLNALPTRPIARDWTTIVNAILARMSMADKSRISQAMHIGWNTSTKELRAYARACTLVQCTLAPPMGAYSNPAQAVRDHLAAWTGTTALKLAAARRRLDGLLGDNAPRALVDGRFDYTRPICPGLSYSHADHPGPGSIGCFVRSRVGGQVYGLSNEHIMKHDSVGPRIAARLILQPASFCGGGFHYVVGEYAQGLKNNQMDAALFRLDPGIAWTNTTPDGRLIAGHAAAAVGDAVSKYGCRTQRNAGQITRANFNAGGYLDQFEVTGAVGFQSNGDSGSILVNAANQVVALMHMGGDAQATGLATPIQRILDHFQVDIA